MEISIYDFLKALDESNRATIIALRNDPPRTTSSGVYNYIADHIEDWIEEAIKIRKD